MAKRDTLRYKLVHDGRVVYYGITDDPERRREEHKEDGKEFDTMMTCPRLLVHLPC